MQMLCENMGAEMADTCKMYVDIYAPAAFAMAMNYLVPGNEAWLLTLIVCYLSNWNEALSCW